MNGIFNYFATMTLLLFWLIPANVSRVRGRNGYLDRNGVYDLLFVLGAGSTSL